MPFIFGYGSLLNLKTHCVKPNNIYYVKLIPNESFSVRRSFNARSYWKNHSDKTNINNTYTALGLEHVDYSKAQIVNGIIFEVDDEQLKNLIIREQNYEMVKLKASMFEFVHNHFGENLLNQNTLIITFIPLKSQYPTCDCPLDNKYIEICLDGFLLFDKKFAYDFIDETSEWSETALTFALDYVNKY